MTQVRTVATPHGDARVHIDRARRAVATLVLGHGAGGGVTAQDLEALAAALPRQGFTVVRVEQPWRVAGKKVAAAPGVLDVGLGAAVRSLRLRTPLVLGGRSAGARSACRSAAGLGAVGVLALSFPLHPPGRPDRSRLAELTSVEVSTLVVQGEADPFGRPDEFPPSTCLAVVPGGDHSFRVPQRGSVTQAEALDIVVEATLEWLVRDVTGNGAAPGDVESRC